MVGSAEAITVLGFAVDRRRSEHGSAVERGEVGACAVGFDDDVGDAALPGFKYRRQRGTGPSFTVVATTGSSSASISVDPPRAWTRTSAALSR